MRDKKIERFMFATHDIGMMSTCVRRNVGCLLLDEYDRIMSTGYNGVPKGQTHCNDKECQGSQYARGERLDLCSAVHAEQNALMQCPDVMRIKACFVTTFPCVHCIKMLLNTSCHVIYYVANYDDRARELWDRAGRIWVKL